MVGPVVHPDARTRDSEAALSQRTLRTGVLFVWRLMVLRSRPDGPDLCAEASTAVVPYETSTAYRFIAADSLSARSNCIPFKPRGTLAALGFMPSPSSALSGAYVEAGASSRIRSMP